MSSIEHLGQYGSPRGPTLPRAVFLATGVPGSEGNPSPELGGHLDIGTWQVLGDSGHQAKGLGALAFVWLQQITLIAR